MPKPQNQPLLLRLSGQRFLDKARTETQQRWLQCGWSVSKPGKMWKILPHGLEDNPESELDGILQHFIAKLRKQDGGVYEPDSVHTILTSLDRFLCDKGWLHSILKDKSFEGCRKVFSGKAIELREKGMGKRKKIGSTEWEGWRATLVENAGKLQSKEPELYHLLCDQPAVCYKGVSGAPSTPDRGPQIHPYPIRCHYICWVGGRSD